MAVTERERVDGRDNGARSGDNGLASFVEVQPEIHEDESVQPNLGTREELPRRLRLIAAPMVVLRWLAVAVGALVWLLVVPLVDLFGGLARRLTRRKPL